MWQIFNRISLYAIFIFTPYLVHIFGTIDYYSDYFSTTFLQPDLSQDVYDFIVVGSGSAGAIVAHRLSKHNKVLLLEAGGNPSPINSVPGMALELINHEATDWKYLTLPQKHACQIFDNNQSVWPRGKVLGGSSTLNWMMYLRGHPNDYNNWANITGDSEWCYEKLLPFFKKSIRRYKGRFSNDKQNYGESPYGFLSIEQRVWEPLYQEFIEAFKEFGYPSDIDMNGPQREGVGTIEVTQENGARHGTYAAILRDNKNPNLKISRHSQAIKIKFDKSNKAVGVWYLNHGVKKIARSKKEIIVSAGTIDSPKLLLLSGVGRPKDLQEIGIKSRIDLPVGKNLHDHLMTFIMPFLIDQPLSFLADRDFGPSLFTEYMFYGRGPLTSPNSANGQGFFSSSKVKKTGIDWPDMQIFFAPAGIFNLMTTTFRAGSRFKADFLEQVLDPYIGKDAIFVPLVLARPKSRGYIKLSSKNPLDAPIIQPNYLEDEEDILTMIEGSIAKLVVKVFENSKAFKKLGCVYPKKPIPGCESYEFGTDNYFRCYIQKWTMTVWHPVGSCRMGKGLSDPEAVLDSKLRVLKTKSLRVIDASVIISIPNANTNAAVYVIAEKGSDSIRQYWSEQYQVSDYKDYLLQRDRLKCYYSRFA